MSKPKSNGLVELVDEKPGIDNNSWNCMDFGFSQAMRKINHGMLPMPVFFKRKTGIALIVTDANDTLGQWNGIKKSHAN